jgi:hypothetical protein
MDEYTFISARWANPEQTAAFVETAEFGQVLVHPGREVLWDKLMNEGPPIGAFRAPPIRPRQVDAEAQRRINALVVPEGADLETVLAAQFRALMRAIRIVNKKIDGQQLTQGEINLQNQLLSLSTATEAIRGKAEDIKALNPIPQNFKDDSFWQ